MSMVYVQHRELCIESERGEGRHADWSRTNEFIVEGVTLDTKNRWGYDAIQIAPAVLEGDRIWVLWVTYRSGDSFGSETGKGEIIWAFTDPKVADNALVALEKRGGKVNSFDFVDEDGEELHLSNPANDYFSRVEGFHLQAFTVGECPGSRY